MLLGWLDARQAANIGYALADQFAPQAAKASAGGHKEAARTAPATRWEQLLRLADRQVRALKLNFYKKARFATAFKCKLIENGMDEEGAAAFTQSLLIHLSQKTAAPAQDRKSPSRRARSPEAAKAKGLLARGNELMAAGSYAQALDFYQALLASNPRHAAALNNLGAAICKLGRYREAEEHFASTLRIDPHFADANSNLGNMLRWKGRFADAEIYLRCALRAKPNHVDARNNLGLTLASLGRLQDARVQFRKVLKLAPRNAEALFGIGHVAAIEGRFDQAEAMFKRALSINPNMPSAWAGEASIRKTTSRDDDWLKRANEIAESGIPPIDEADMRFAIGKYSDDVGDFEQAFRNYRRANELLSAVAEGYDRSERASFVDDLIRVYTRDVVAGEQTGASASTKPVFVVGMMRSGTSLAEQIIASHPAAKGAGELAFWSKALGKHEVMIRQGPLDQATRQTLAQSYLRDLEARFGDVLRIVDKAPVNSDYLGVIHSVFPNARMIYMRRDPVDTCLSCYFQKFTAGMAFTLDLSDLAHYYREHERLIAHWHAVLPPGTILEVPYEKLVADPAAWTRKILDFLDLEWSDRCLNFNETQRLVVTASYWQVRQKIYKSSVDRWRNYRPFIGPLLALRD